MEVATRTGLLLLWATTIPVLAAGATTTTSASSSSSTSYPFDLGSDITDFIPSCALSCFESFVEVNFNTSICGTSPSLQCLCAYTGSTGYTIGEGALECIVAENDTGACEGMDAGSDTVASAYAMCDKEPGAASETHATIIATLIVPPTGPVIVPNPSSTETRSSSHSWTTSYMTPSVTVAPTRSTSASNLTSSTSSSSSSSTTVAAVSGTSAPTPSAAAASSKLTAAQIGGIAGGCAAAALIAALAFFFFMRRRRGQPLTGFSRMRDSWSPRRNMGPSPQISAPRYQEPKSMSFSRALAQRVSRNMARPDTIGLAISAEGGGMQGAARQPGESMVAANIPPATAAAAQRHSPSPPPIPPLSPLRAQSNFNFFPPQDQQQSQPQAQYKPALTVAIPPQRTALYNRSSTISNNRMPFGGGRDSVVTEFAEDGETSAGPGSAQIWRPPNTDPQSSTTYYVADKWGNWVLGGTGPDEQIAELPTPASKTAAEREAEQERDVPESRAVKEAVKDLSSPTLPSTSGVLKIHQARSTPGRQTIRQVPPESGRLPVNSRSSSVYSTFSMNFSLPQTVQPGPGNPMPTTNTTATRKDGPSPNPESYYAGAGTGGGRPIPSRDLTGRPRRGSSSNRDRTNTMMSQDSATTIASSIGSEVGVDSFPAPARQPAAPEQQHQQQQQQQQQGSLSPVVESPGRSPVSYPTIPRPGSNAPGSNNRQNINRNPPGGQGRNPLQGPALRVVNASQASDSPTLGVVDSQKPVQMGTAQAAAPTQARISYYNPPKRQSVNPNPNRNPGQVRSGSPETIGGVSTSLGRTQLQQQPPVPSIPQDAVRSQPFQSFRQHVDSRSDLPSQSYYGPMSIYDAYTRPESDYPQRPLPVPLQHQRQLHHHQHQYQHQNQPYTAASAPSPPSASNSPSTSTSSASLLAKRLGAEKAAAFQRAAPVENPHNSSQARWKRRSSRQGGNVGPGPGPDDMAGPPTPRALVVRKDGGAGRREGEEDAPLPATPGWKPQLTPKRRGGDLYLSVQ